MICSWLSDNAQHVLAPTRQRRNGYKTIPPKDQTLTLLGHRRAELESSLLHTPLGICSSQSNLLHQPPRSIHGVHYNLHQHDVLWTLELFLREHSVQLLLCLGTEITLLALFLTHAEQAKRVRVIPRRDVVVLLLCAVDDSLDSIACVVDQQYHRFRAVCNHGAEFLDRELQAAVAGDKDGPASLCTFLGFVL